MKMRVYTDEVWPVMTVTEPCDDGGRSSYDVELPEAFVTEFMVCDKGRSEASKRIARHLVKTGQKTEEEMQPWL